LGVAWDNVIIMYNETVKWLRGLPPKETLHGNVPVKEAADRLEAIGKLHSRLLAEQGETPHFDRYLAPHPSTLNQIDENGFLVRESME
jgi:hypothetical protein